METDAARFLLTFVPVRNSSVCNYPSALRTFQSKQYFHRTATQIYAIDLEHSRNSRRQCDASISLSRDFTRLFLQTPAPRFPNLVPVLVNKNTSLSRRQNFNRRPFSFINWRKRPFRNLTVTGVQLLVI